MKLKNYSNKLKEFYFKLYREEKFKWTLIPYTFLFFIGIVFFLCTTWNKIDQKWTDALFQWNWNWMPIRYFCRFMFTLGTNQQTVLLPLTGLVAIETVFLYKFKKHYNYIYIIYALFAIVWIVLNVKFIINSYYNGTGYTPSTFDCEFFVPRNTYFWTNVIICSINTVIFTFACWWVNQRLAKKDYFLEERYWLKAVEFVSFVIITYIIATLLKQSTGRPEYIYDHYEEVFGKLIWDPKSGKYIGFEGDDLSDLVKSIPGAIDQTTGKVKKEWIDDLLNAANCNGLRPANYFEWWQINGNFWSNLKYWLPWSLITNPDLKQMPAGWNIRNFPSGHIIATMALSGYGFIFLYNKHFKNWVKISFTVVWFLNVFALGMSLMISGVHWISDVSFTLVNGSFWYAFAPILTDKVVARIQRNKIEQSEEVKKISTKKQKIESKEEVKAISNK